MASPELLRSGQVQVWRLRLDLSPHQLERLMGELSQEEQRRAAAFRFPLHAARFVAARGQLRQVLASYLGTAPRAVRFRYGVHGKPDIDGAGLQFNLSHCEGHGLIAVSRQAAVGVDVELERPVPDALALSRSVFTAAEQAELTAAADSARARVFLQGWTRKEALIKALGLGFSAATDQLEVGLAPVPVQVLPGPWQISSLRVGRGLVAALAVQGEAAGVEIAAWTTEPPCLA